MFYRDEYEKAISTKTREERDREYQAKQINQMRRRNAYIPPHLRKSSDSSPEQSPVFNRRSSSDEEAQNEDPHHDLRERARKKLVKEGVLQTKQAEDKEMEMLTSNFSTLNVRNK